MPILVWRTTSLKLLREGLLFRAKEKLDRNRTIAITYAICCKSLLFHWGLGLAERLRTVEKRHGFILLFCIL